MKTIALMLALLAAAPGAAQEFPSRPLRIVVPNPAGGTVDFVARALAQSMGPALGHNVVVEIRSGGNTIIGSEQVARAAPDGHTILMVGTPFAMNPLLRPLPYDSDRDFSPVARLVSLPYVIAVHPSLGARSLGELVALRKVNYASFAIGQLIGETFKQLSGADLNFVPYQGGVQATTSVVGGHAGVLIGPLSDATPHIVAGRLRALAVTSLERSEALKEVPTVAESGYPGFEWVSWIGAAVPAGTPPPVIERLSAQMLRALQQPEAQAAFARLSVSVAPQGPEQFARFIRSQRASYDKIIRQANIKPD